MTIFFDLFKNPVELPENEEIFWRISAYALIKNKENKILMTLPTYDTSKWMLPGGGISTSEKVLDGIVRECYEETGYRVKITSNTPIFFGETAFFHEKKFLHSLNLVFSASLISDKQDEHMINSAEKDEIAKVEWIPITNLNEKNCRNIIFPAIQTLKK